MREPDLEKLNALVGKLVGDLGISLGGASILIGDRLGLYKAMADGVPVTSSELAKKTDLHERYVREWLAGQAASGYIDYHSEKNAFSLSPEQAMAFAEEGSPAFFAGAFDVVQATYLDEPKVAEAFRTGKGVGWHEHSKCLFSGTERFFRPGYNANLVSNWIPTLEGVEAKLKAGARVADVGCGHGASPRQAQGQHRPRRANLDASRTEQACSSCRSAPSVARSLTRHEMQCGPAYGLVPRWSGCPK